MALTAPNASSARYAQHHPEQTLLYQIVAEHLETFLEEARSEHERGLPKYVEREFQAYLACGIHAHGFLRARCRHCGKDLLVAFSCKKRGVCPSCNARRMCGTAAHLNDRVFPSVPVRQWVLSVPFELRLLLAKNHRALSAVGRIFVREVFHWQCEQAALMGIPHARAGAVCFPQRFGGSLNLNVHYHVAVPDGVFADCANNDRAEFQPLRRPSPGDLDTIALNVEMRVLAWLRRRNLIAEREDEPSGESSRSALDACLEGSLGLGELAALPDGGQAVDPLALPRASKSARRAGRSRGFDVHAGVVISGSDREARERLLRYCARPALSLERLSRLPDGRVAYALRKPSGKETHRVMQPTQFLARLAALVPPPRHPLGRFHGVFAPHSAWRKKVVPASDCGPSRCAAASAHDALPDTGARASSRRRGPSGTKGGAAMRPSPADSPPSQRVALDAAVRGEPRFSFARIEWAALLKRIYDVDALACPCGGRLRFMELILEVDLARSILESLGLPMEPPPVARARSPDLRDPIPPEW